MLVVLTIFTAFSALLIVAAPLPAYHGKGVASTADVNSRSILYRRAPPKYNIPHRFVTPTQRKDTIDRMKTHYETEATEGQKWARYASVASRWNTVSPNSAREYLTFNYHEGENENTPIIHPQAKIYRDKPVPKLVGHMKAEHRDEITKASVKRYNTLSPAYAERVKSMRVMDDWGLNGGILDKTTLTFHYTMKPTDSNIIGAPVTIHRPLTVKLPDIPLLDKAFIEHNVRKAHTKMAADPQHPATTSNYATVHSDWQAGSPDENGRRPRKFVMKLEEVSRNEQQKKHLGYYSVQMGTSEYEQVGTPPPYTETSHAGPSNQVPHPPGSQYQQHSNAGSSSTHILPSNCGSSNPNSQGLLLFTAGNPSAHALPPNSKSLHLGSQGGSQFTTGNPSLHPESSHPEPLQPVSPQQQQQHPIGNLPPHNEYYVPSPEPWRPRDPASRPHETWHSGLYSDQLWNPESPPANSQTLAHPNNPSPQPGTSSHSGLSHTELSHPASPQQPLQHLIGSPLSHNQYYVPSPELWRPWDPGSQPHETWHSGLYSDQLWNPESPPANSQTHLNSPSTQFGVGTSSHPELLHPSSSQQQLQPHTVSPPPNSQIPHPNSPPLHPGRPSPSSAQSGIAVLPGHQLGPSSNPGGSPHPNHSDDELSPEIWNILNHDSVYPYPWNPHHSP